MNLEMLLVSILPLVVFVFVEFKYGVKAGIITAIILSILLGIWYFAKTQELDTFILVEVGLLAGLGWLSIKMKDSKLFKFQPAIVGVLFAGYCIWLQVFGEPVFVRMKKIMVTMNPEMSMHFSHPQIDSFLTSLSLHTVIVLLIHAGLVAWAALRLGSLGWVITRLAIYPLLLATVIAERFIFHPL